jgi:hypothetical protein
VKSNFKRSVVYLLIGLLIVGVFSVALLKKEAFSRSKISNNFVLSGKVILSPGRTDSKEEITLSPPVFPPTNTLAPFIPGINEMSYAPYVNPKSAVITSQWRGMVNNQRTYVYAGARLDTSSDIRDTSQGIVVVEVNSTNLSNNLVTFYDAPRLTGVLRITKSNGYRLTLITQNGVALYFDVPTRQFVGGLRVTSTAPTITPIPSLESTDAVSTAASKEYPPLIEHSPYP